MSTRIRSRIAPTPSGHLHIGNAYSFLLTEALVSAHNGVLRLRIDDLDAPRVREAYLADIFETLYWLGIRPGEGPKNIPDHQAHFTQQGNIESYDRLLRELVKSGRVFACTCSRADVLKSSADGHYPGTCRDKGLPLDLQDAAWRFRTDEHDKISWQDGILGAQIVSPYEHVRDFIVRRRDGLPAYHIASLADDVAQDVTLIVRGADLLHSTAAQLYLAAAAGLEIFLQCRFYHHPLVTDDAGNKLSKSAGSDSLQSLRQSGVSAAAIRQAAAAWYGSFLPHT